MRARARVAHARARVHGLARLFARAQTPNYLDSLDPDPVLRPVRSEQDLADMNSLGMFTRRSSFADVPYLALPGINSRVSCTTSRTSAQSELGESFMGVSDVTLMPSFTSALLKATFTALLSAFQFGCERAHARTPAVRQPAQRAAARRGVAPPCRVRTARARAGTTTAI